MNSARCARHARTPSPYGARMINRKELVDHLDWVLRPPLPVWLVDEIQHALELAVAGRDQELVEINGRGYTVRRAVELFELKGLVESARHRAA